MKYPMVKIEDVFEVARGGSPRPIDKYLTEDEDGINWIMIGDTKAGGKYIEKTAKKIIKEGLSKTRFVNEGDFLLTNSMSFGRPYILKTSGCIHDGWLVLSPKTDSIHRDFFYYYLGSDEIKKELKSKAAGAVVKNLNKEIVQKIQIPLPPLSEQRRIADLLDVADALRQKDKALLEKYEALGQSLFLELFGDPVKNEKGWEVKEFGTKITSLKYGASSPPVYSESGIPFIRATNVKGGYVSTKGLVYISEQEALKITKCKLKEGDLIIVRSGANTGDCCRITKEYVGSYGGFDIIIEIEEPFSTFYNFLINSKAGKAIIDPLTRRAGQPHLNSTQITEMKFISPDISLQNHFSEQLQFIEKQKELAKKNLVKSEALFQGLLGESFGG